MIYGYARVSTAAQDESGQVRPNSKRPGAKRQRAGAGIRSLAEPFLDTTSDFAEIIFAILGVAAKLERRRILERASRGRADAKANVLGTAARRSLPRTSRKRPASASTRARRSAASLARGLVRKKVEVVNYPDGRFAVQFNGATSWPSRCLTRSADRAARRDHRQQAAVGRVGASEGAAGRLSSASAARAHRTAAAAEQPRGGRSAVEGARTTPSRRRGCAGLRQRLERC